MNCNDVTELSSLYLGGELDAGRSAELAAHLEGCAECARNLEADAEMDARLRDAVLAENVDARDIDGEVRRKIGGVVRRRRLWMGAGIAATVIFGVLAYRTLGVADPLCADAALDHRQEVIEHERRTWVTDPGAVASLAARHGIATTAIDALAPAGYRLEHARLCRLNGRVFLHLVYAGGAHEISIFLGRPDSASAALRSASVGGETIEAFGNGRVAAIVVTQESRERTREIARQASSVL